MLHFKTWWWKKNSRSSLNNWGLRAGGLFLFLGLVLSVEISDRAIPDMPSFVDPPIGEAYLDSFQPRIQPAIQPTATFSPATFPSRPTLQPRRTRESEKPAFSGVPETIGISVSGSPIQVFRFGTGPVQRIIVAGIHGGYERNTVTLALQLIDYINGHPEIIPSRITLFILPVLNPDGAARAKGPDGRTNDHGVDLNRNFPAFWKKSWRLSGCWQLRPVTGGETPLSEPETKALVSFLNSHTIDALISYHSAGLGIFPGGQPPVSFSVSLAEALHDVSGYPYPPTDIGCEYTGELVDWASINGIAAVDVELTNHHDTELDKNLRLLSRFLRWRSLNHSGDE